MRGTREEVANNRRRIVAVASRLFRIHGHDGVTVATIMQQAGLTHGDFYGHFASKAALEAEASALAFQTSASRWLSERDQSSDPLGAIFAQYLSRAHVDAPGTGCAMPALCADADRSEAPELGDIFAEGIGSLAGELETLLPEDAPEDAALHIVACLAGAVLLARSVGNRPLGDRVLAATLRHLRRETGLDES